MLNTLRPSEAYMRQWINHHWFRQWPDRRQAIIWTNFEISLNGPYGINLSDILIDVRTFWLKKIHLKMSSGKWQPRFVTSSIHCGNTSYESYMSDYNVVWRHPGSVTVVGSLRQNYEFEKNTKTQNLEFPQNIQHITWIFYNDAVIKWKHFLRYWPFVRGIHRWLVNSLHKGQWRGALMFVFYLRLNKRSSKQSRRGWFETPMRSLWRQGNMSRISSDTRYNQDAIWEGM